MRQTVCITDRVAQPQDSLQTSGLTSRAQYLPCTRRIPKLLEINVQHLTVISTLNHQEIENDGIITHLKNND